MSFSLSSILEMLHELNACSITVRLLLAALLGGLVGSERGKHGRAAGLRTHILVCVGAAVTVLVGLYSVQIFQLNSDPLRLGAQVISGIGFLGAGTILHHEHSRVTGLTTAAGLWTTSSIGLAIGSGAYWVAFLAFIIVLITIALLTRLEHSRKQASGSTYYLELDDICRVNTLFEDLSCLTETFQLVPAKSGLPSHVGITLLLPSTYDETTFLRRFRTAEGVLTVIPLTI